jgi:hypothetical protein
MIFSEWCWQRRGRFGIGEVRIVLLFVGCSLSFLYSCLDASIGFIFQNVAKELYGAISCTNCCLVFGGKKKE